MSHTPTKRQLAARHLRRLRTMRAQITDMANQWEDVDQYTVNRLQELSDQVEEMAVELVDEDAYRAGERL